MSTDVKTTNALLKNANFMQVACEKHRYVGVKMTTTHGPSKKWSQCIHCGKRKITKKEQVLDFVEKKGSATYSEIVKFAYALKFPEDTTYAGLTRGFWSSAFEIGRGWLVQGETCLRKNRHGKWEIDRRSKLDNELFDVEAIQAYNIERCICGAKSSKECLQNCDKLPGRILMGQSMGRAHRNPDVQISRNAFREAIRKAFDDGWMWGVSNGYISQDRIEHDYALSDTSKDLELRFTR